MAWVAAHLETGVLEVRCGRRSVRRAGYGVCAQRSGSCRHADMVGSDAGSARVRHCCRLRVDAAHRLYYVLGRLLNTIVIKLFRTRRLIAPGVTVSLLRLNAPTQLRKGIRPKEQGKQTPSGSATWAPRRRARFACAHASIGRLRRRHAASRRPSAGAADWAPPCAALSRRSSAAMCCPSCSQGARRREPRRR